MKDYAVDGCKGTKKQRKTRSYICNIKPKLSQSASF